MAKVLLLLSITAFTFACGSTNGSPSYCIKKETYGAFTAEDLDRMVEYSINKEYKALSNMISQGRVIHLNKGAEIVIKDAGLLKSAVRQMGNERQIWVVTDAVSECK